MKRWLIVFMVIFVLLFSTVSLVAGDGPVGGCPDDFHLHTLMKHDADHQGQHQHVGNDVDLNADGWICGKHASVDGSVHVHIDNYVPLP